ncbi:MAG: HNH endonuclease [Candidatus Peribacteraceae bacterium]|nr:HNH endonuclease [Candidatus Peribacteraceae bacterium]
MKLNYLIEENDEYEGEDEVLGLICSDDQNRKVFDWVDVVRDYKSGLSTNKLADKYNRKPKDIWLGLVTLGVTLRPNKGKTHHNWKGGITPENARIRGSTEMQRWRLNVLERDKNRCQKCNTLKKPQVHHVMSFAKHPDKRFDVDNGITLCKSCHKLFHRKHGNKPENPQGKVNDFICNKMQKSVDS